MKHKLIKHEEDYYCLLNDKGEVIADVNGVDILKLSLKNCQAVERGFDLDALAENWVFTLNGHKWSNNDNTAGDNYGSFMAGAKTILAIFMDKKFTEEDIKSSILFGRGMELWKEEEQIQNYIQSLKKNEWDVEICCLMDCQGDYDVCENTSFDCELCTNTGVPKLDEDGCLILKK